MTLKTKNGYDLEDRTVKFSESIIDLSRKVSNNVITMPIINQLMRSATSIGANYREANGASSKKDFKNKIFLCKKEAKETDYWLRLLGKSIDDEKLKQECRECWKEVHQLILIFSKIASSTK